MAIRTALSEDGKERTIAIKGRFDFICHQDFRQAYQGHDSVPAESYVIDLQDATYLDSSALGMLLLLRDHAGGDNARIRIIHCNDDVRRILTISNFQRLFSIA